MKLHMINEILNKYIEELIKWNRMMSLISKNDESLILERHINDSLSLVDYIDINSSILDIGSGAGFPGIILSCYGYSNITLCESNFKKCLFLRHVISKLNLKSTVINDRVENINQRFDIAIARGFSSIKNILKSFSLCNKYILLKGLKYLEEIEEAKLFFNFTYSVVKKNKGVILIIDQ